MEVRHNYIDLRQGTHFYCVVQISKYIATLHLHTPEGTNLTYSTHDATETRRDNLRALATSLGGPSALATRLGYANASFLVQMIGPNPTRRVSERTARSIETALGLAPFSLDQANAPRTPNGSLPALHADILAKTMDDVAAACRELSMTLPTAKFADVVAFVYREAAERGRPPDNEFIKRIIQLTT